mgnify:CR=1 FL=1
MTNETNQTVPTIVIDEVEYSFDSLSDKQKVLVQHIADLDRKLAEVRFNMDQLQVGRGAFISLLKTDLAEEKKE